MHSLTIFSKKLTETDQSEFLPYLDTGENGCLRQMQLEETVQYCNIITTRLLEGELPNY